MLKYNYPTKKLGEVAILNPKKSEIKSFSDNSLVSFIPMSAVDDVTKTITDFETRKLGAVRKGYTYFKNNDVLFAKITPCMENGKVAIAKNLENGIGFGSTEFHILRPTKEITSDWIFHIIASQSFRDEAQKQMHGVAGQKRVPIGFLENYEIPLPPIAEQRKIVARIEKQFAKIDEAARLRAESEKLAAELLPAALHEIFTSAESKGWEEKELGEIFQINRGGSPRPIKEHLTSASDGINWIKIGDAQEGFKYITSTKEKIKKTSTSKTRLVYKGDLILSNSMSFGHPYILDIDGAIHDGWLLLRAKSSDIDKEFAYYVLGSGALFHSFKNLAAGGVVKNLNSDLVRGVKIPLPPIAEQKKIVKKLDALVEKSRTLRDLQSSQSADLKSLKQSILHQAFSGKLI